MGYRIHTTTPGDVNVRYVDPERFFENDEMAVGSALVLDDGGNQEAFVLVGTPDEIGEFAGRVLATVRGGTSVPVEEAAALLAEAGEFDRKCAAAQYTDSGDAINLYRALAENLATITGLPSPEWGDSDNEE